MTSVSAKERLLDEAGYSYKYERELYVNRHTKKAFSIDFIEDHPAAELQAKMHEPSSSTGEWQFYFNETPSPTLQRELSLLLP